MDTAQWPQEIVVKPMEEIIPNTSDTSKSSSSCVVERKARPQKDQAVNCPRCNSTNTKFCYYNNYSLSQPRYFCKTCRRYWTEGGSLRSIPVGGGSRKNKKSSILSSSSSNNSSPYSSNVVNPLKKLPDLVLPTPHHDHGNPSKIHIDGSQDLNLGFSSDFKTISELIRVPNYDGGNNNNSNKDITSPSTISPLPPQSSSSSSPSQLSALELISGITSRGLNTNSFMQMPISHDPNSVYSSGFSMPSLNFSLDHGLGTNYGNHLQETTSGRFLFPFVGLKQVSSTTTTTNGTTHDQHDNGDHQPNEESTNGYWNGMLGGGGSW